MAASFTMTSLTGPGIFRADKSGLNEELGYTAPQDSYPSCSYPALLFPGGNDLLLVAHRKDSQNVRTFFRLDPTQPSKRLSLGEVVRNGDAAWGEPGKTLLFSRNINGLTNIWRYGLRDRRLTQITFGTGPDFSPMPDPGGTRNLLCEWQVLRVPDCLPRALKRSRRTSRVGGRPRSPQSRQTESA